MTAVTRTTNLELAAASYQSPGKADLDGRGHWWHEFLEDWARYAACHGDKWLRALAFEQGLWALFQYRLSSAVYRSTGPLRTPALAMAVVTQKMIEILTNVRIPFQADLAPGQYIGHFGPTIFHNDVVIGTGCNISQGVTIGVSGRGDRRGVPTIGRRVYIGANAIVVGHITVGDDSVIGANALVTRDVPAGSTVSGNPATVVDSRGNTGMGLHQHPMVSPSIQPTGAAAAIISASVGGESPRPRPESSSRPTDSSGRHVGRPQG